MEITLTDARSQIHALEKEQMALINSGRGDEAVDMFYAPDAVFMPNHAPTARGLDEIHASMQAMGEMGLKSLALETGDVFVAGDVVWNHGTFTVTFETPDGPIEDTGRFVTVFRRQDDGSLKCVTDIFNSDVPLPI